MTSSGEVVSAITNARLTGVSRTDPFDSDPVDVLISDGRVADLAPAGALRLRGPVLDADGAHVMPGLWDHHVHVAQWSLLAERTPLLGAATAVEAAAIMGGAALLEDGTRVGSGFRDALWPDAPTLELLDRATGEVPTYLINADVHSVWLNSAAFRREGFAATPDGLLREEPAFEISRRLNTVAPVRGDRLVAAAMREAAARGVVGIVDLDMAWNAESWARRLDAGFTGMRVQFGIYRQHLERAIAEGLATGDALDPRDQVQVGPFKVITDGSLGTRTAACSHPYPGSRTDRGVLTVPPDELIDWMTTATGAGIACAIHAIGDRANTAALDAFALTGATGTIEHAQLVAHADVPRFARLGVAASLQPEHALDDRDLSDREWAAQTAMPYPMRSLLDADANLLFGSDAPVSLLDPWVQISAAVARTNDDRPAWHPEEALSAAAALAASTAGGTDAGFSIEIGDVADLIVVGSDPLGATGAGLRRMPVHATVLAGEITHQE